jgi:Na+-transporting methylmalonyl-CoA/oxaloacetate decarboxylase gamma subunit
LGDGELPVQQEALHFHREVFAGSINMESLDLISVCISAFAVVFLLLAGLALVMRLIVMLFPARESEGSPDVAAAISTVVQSHYPGAQVTKIEELK